MLELESVQLEEKLGQWKEGIYSTPQTPKQINEVATASLVERTLQPRKSAMLRSGLTTAYLKGLSNAGSISSFRHFPLNWPLPLLVNEFFLKVHLNYPK